MSISHKKDRLKHRGRDRKARPKTFKSEEAAKKYAEANNIKDYKLVNIKSTASKTKKIKIC